MWCLGASAAKGKSSLIHLKEAELKFCLSQSHTDTVGCVETAACQSVRFFLLLDVHWIKAFVSFDPLAMIPHQISLAPAVRAAELTA